MRSYLSLVICGLCLMLPTMQFRNAERRVAGVGKHDGQGLARRVYGLGAEGQRGR